MKDIKNILDKIPILKENPFADISDKCYAKSVAEIKLNYILSGSESQSGYIFGKNKKNTILYFSRYSSNDKIGRYANNSSNISLKVENILSIDVLKEF